MEKITITEALSEINLIKKKIEGKKTEILNNLAKVAHVPDPYANQGGGFAANKAQLQSIKDLNSRLTRIRGAISGANIANTISIMGETKTINDWLTWKREISVIDSKFLMDLCTKSKANMDHWAKQPQVYKDDSGTTHLVKYESNIDYVEVLKESERTSEIFEKLDGQLSLKNATIVIEI